MLIDWDHYRRSDQIEVAQDLGGNWIIIPIDREAVVSQCPTCRSEMRSAMHAMRVADELFPQKSDRNR